jgi:hypothetical protein
MSKESRLGHSISALAFPQRLTVDALNTANWALNSIFIEHDAYHITIAGRFHCFHTLLVNSEAPFWSGTIPRESSDIRSVLMIGLGGANFNNYLAEKYDFVNGVFRVIQCEIAVEHNSRGNQSFGRISSKEMVPLELPWRQT